MLDVIEPAPMGHNTPPTPMEEVADEFDAVISEAANWTDGEPVTTEDGLKALDVVIKEFKSYKSALVKAGKEHTTPPHTAWKACVAQVKVYTDDADVVQSALVATGADYRQKLVAEKEAIKRAAYEEANRLEREANAKLEAANAASLEEQREAQAAIDRANEAKQAAQDASRDKVKGLRKTTHFEIEDIQKALNHIATNDKPALAAFVEGYVQKHHKTTTIAGVNVWETKEAF